MRLPKEKSIPHLSVKTKEILTSFSKSRTEPLFLMNQIEIWFGIINRQLLKRKSFTSVQMLEQCIIDYINQYNRYFAHPFNWKYNSVPEQSKENAA